MNNENPKITKIETFKDIQKFMWSRQTKSEKQELGSLCFYGMIGLILFSLLYFSSENSTQKKAPTTTQIIQNEKVLRSIIYDQKTNNKYQTNVELYQSELSILQNKISQLKKDKDMLNETVENRKAILKNEMALKNEIKELELSKANGEGYSQGYDDGLRKGNNNSDASLGAGLFLGHILTK